MKRRNPEACQPSCWDFASAISLQGLVWVHVHQSRDLFWILATKRKLAIPWTTCQNLPPHRQCLRYRALQRPSSGRGRKVWKMQTPSSWLFQKALARHLVLLWKVQATGVSRSMKNHDSFISVSVCLYCSCPWCRVIWNSNLDIVCRHHPFAGCCMMLRDASIVTISTHGKPPELSVQCRPSSFPSLLRHLKNHLDLGSMRHVGLKRSRHGVEVCSHSNDEHVRITQNHAAFGGVHFDASSKKSTLLEHLFNAI